MALTATLRAETREAHTATDRAVLASDPFGSISAYTEFIDRLAAFHRSVERLVAGDDLTARTGHRPKAELAACDLRQLGVEPGEHSPSPGDEIARATPTDPATTAGRLYVIEGSTLGGRHLARLARRRLPEVAAATTFLEAYGDDVDERWVRTTNALDEAAVDPTIATRAARDTFDLARSVLRCPAT